MANPGAVLKFPGGKDKPEVSIPLTRESPKLDEYDQNQAIALYQIAISVKNKAEDLWKFVEENRQIARQAGIEMLAVQISSILEGEKFQRVVDALEDSVYRRTPLALTREGVDKIHRLEKLISEADASIVQFMTGKRPEPTLGQNIPAYPSSPVSIYADRGDRHSNELSSWIPVIVIGIAGIVGVIAIIALTNRTQEPVKVPTPAPVPTPPLGKSRKS